VVIGLYSWRRPDPCLVDPWSGYPLVQPEIGNSERGQIPTLASIDNVECGAEGNVPKLAEYVGLFGLVALIRLKDVIGRHSEDSLRRGYDARRAVAEDLVPVDFPTRVERRTTVPSG